MSCVCGALVSTRQGGRRQDKRACERVSLSLGREAGRTGGRTAWGSVAHTPATGEGGRGGAARVCSA
jgi:hypothetical protein